MKSWDNDKNSSSSVSGRLFSVTASVIATGKINKQSLLSNAYPRNIWLKYKKYILNKVFLFHFFRLIFILIFKRRRLEMSYLALRLYLLERSCKVFKDIDVGWLVLLLEKQGWTHKRCTLMDPHTWPCKSRTTSTNIHSAAMWGYGMLSWRPA